MPEVEGIEMTCAFCQTVAEALDDRTFVWPCMKHVACLTCTAKNFQHFIISDHPVEQQQALACPYCRAAWTPYTTMNLWARMRRAGITAAKINTELAREDAEARRHRNAATANSKPVDRTLTPPELMSYNCCPDAEGDLCHMNFTAMFGRGIIDCSTCGLSIDVVGPQRLSHLLLDGPEEMRDCPLHGIRGLVVDFQTGERWWACLEQRNNVTTWIRCRALRWELCDRHDPLDLRFLSSSGVNLPRVRGGRR